MVSKPHRLPHTCNKLNRSEGGNAIVILSTRATRKTMYVSIMTLYEKYQAKFLKLLPDEPIKSGISIVKKVEVPKAIFKLSDADGSMKFSCLSKGSVPKTMITEDDVYFIDGSQGLYVYIGDNCSVAEKNNSLSHAHAYLAGTDHPFSPITVVGPGQKDQQLSAFLD
ncbi:hypothetical protein Ciccas_000173 [Cichlidogyrus casuarinus]|uniref:Gelsolin-like domain-containing protein n=1 Tax=Cichlidogyrus casuarinus TaxID=1844966 RepID=A0ABD2QNV9_9PLAT